LGEHELCRAKLESSKVTIAPNGKKGSVYELHASGLPLDHEYEFYALPQRQQLP